MPAGVLAAGAGAFPAAEGLEAGPRACRRALRTVGIGYASFDVVEEPFGFCGRTVEASRQTVVYVVGDLHGFIQAVDFADCGDGQEHLMIPQAMREGQVGDKSGFAEESFVIYAASFDLAASQEFSSALFNLFAVVLEIFVSGGVDYRSCVRAATRWVTDYQF